MRHDRAWRPHKKPAGFVVVVLVRMQYVAAMGGKKLGNGGHKTRAVGAID
jgi:hypothetical protein